MKFQVFARHSLLAAAAGVLATLGCAPAESAPAEQIGTASSASTQDGSKTFHGRGERATIRYGYSTETGGHYAFEYEEMDYQEACNLFRLCDWGLSDYPMRLRIKVKNQPADHGSADFNRKNIRDLEATYSGTMTCRNQWGNTKEHSVHGSLSAQANETATDELWCDSDEYWADDVRDITVEQVSFGRPEFD